MKNFTSFEEIESLCLAVVTDYMRTGSRAGTLCVDIEDLVTDYLGIPLVWETFAEPDPGRVGFFSDGKRPLEIIRKGKKQEAVFPEGTAVVDKRLLAPGESARRRFTVAHEGAHGLLARHLPAPAAPAFYSVYDPDAEYDGSALREMLAFSECMANRAAACLLMPRFLVEKAMTSDGGPERLTVYDGGVIAPSQKLRLVKAADALGVSYTAMRIRLRELDLVDRRPVEEYLREGLGYGGGRRAG